MVHVFCESNYDLEHYTSSYKFELLPPTLTLQAVQDMDKVFQKAQNLAQMLLKAAADWKQLVLLPIFNVVLKHVGLQLLRLALFIQHIQILHVIPRH